VSISDEILKEGVATAKAISDIRSILNQDTAQAMASLNPPTPISNQTPPRVNTNEKMLAAENEGLKKQLAEMHGETKRLSSQLASAYKLIEGFRIDFAQTIEALNGKVYDVQHSVYEALGGYDAGSAPQS